MEDFIITVDVDLEGDVCDDDIFGKAICNHLREEKLM